MPQRANDTSIAISLVIAVILWGATNAGTKYVVGVWPPIWTGGSRFLLAGLVLFGVLRFSRWLGSGHPVDSRLSWQLWLRGGLSLAVYIVIFNTALIYTAASNVAVYLGAAPIWALLWERPPRWDRDTLKRYGSAALALTGVIVLFWPSLHLAGSSWIGHALSLAASLLWTNYGWQCRLLTKNLSGAEVSAHTMWRAGVILMPLALIEVSRTGLALRADLLAIHVYCILAGGVAAFAIWNRALQHWPASQVLLFNNLIPLSTTTWAHFTLGEALSTRFWLAMVMVVTGVVLGQTNWQKILPPRAVPPD